MGELRGTKAASAGGRAHAVAAAERGATGALPLLGAPLLAVIATFVLQPKSSDLYQNGGLAFEAEAATAPELDAAPQSDDEAGPWAAVQQALDAKRFDVARSLLADSPERAAGEHWQAYAMMLDCLERPSNEATNVARRFYLEGAPADVRPDLFRTCLSAP